MMLDMVWAIYILHPLNIPFSSQLEISAIWVIPCSSIQLVSSLAPWFVDANLAEGVSSFQIWMHFPLPDAIPYAPKRKDPTPCILPYFSSFPFPCLAFWPKQSILMKIFPYEGLFPSFVSVLKQFPYKLSAEIQVHIFRIFDSQDSQVLCQFECIPIH